MRKVVLQATCAFALFALAAWAQVMGGTLTGKITSASGVAVPNAAITVTNINTNNSEKALTGPDGNFTVSNLSPGTYKIEVESAGFKRTSQQDITLSSTAPTTVNITLEAGNMNETVEIKGTTPVTQPYSAENSMGLGTRIVRELPLIDRNYQQLVELQTGITPPTPVFDPLHDPDSNRFFSANGQSPFANMWQLDGVSNQEPFRHTAIRVQPVESVRELNIVTNLQNVTDGYNLGAFVTNMSRPGTAGWHGSLFEFNSGNYSRSRSFFNVPNNPTPRFVYNQFGATVGGAIVPDKTFAFFSYEGNYQSGQSTTVNTVPTTAAVGGDFSGIPGVTIFNPFSGLPNGIGRTPFAGDVIPAGLINPTAAAIASQLPAPNQPGFVNNLVSNVPFRRNYQKLDGRIDQHMRDRTTVFLRYGYSNILDHQDSPFGSVVGATSGDSLVSQNAILGITHTISPSLITDFRMGYNRYDQKLKNFQNASALGFAGVNNNLIGINIAGLTSNSGAPAVAPIGSAADSFNTNPFAVGPSAFLGVPADVPQNGVDNTFDWVWSWNWHTSKHDVQFGTDIRRIRSDGFINPLFGTNGTSSFGPGPTLPTNVTSLIPNGLVYNSFASFLLGAPEQVGVNNFLTTPTVRQLQMAYWVGDKIHLANRITADLGLRYDLFSPLSPRNPGGAQYFNPANNTFNYAGIGGTPMDSSDWEMLNFAPRIGLAMRLTNRTVVRTGYAINYFQPPYIFSGLTAPTTGSVTGVTGTFAAAPFAGTFGPTVTSTVPPPTVLVNGASAGNLPATIIDRNLETPYVQTFSFQIQQDFYAGTLLSVGYVGTLGRHLPFNRELNAAAPGTGVAGLPFIGLGRTASTLFFTNGINNNFNSVQGSLTKRYSHGLSFTAAYTFSKALGYTNDNGFLPNPFNLRSNYGPLNYDRAQVLSISHLYELPFGRNGSHLAKSALGDWQLNGVFTWHTGTPLTAFSNPVLCNCPGNPEVFASSLVSRVTLGSGSPTYLLPSQFAEAAPGTFGNLNRGSIYGPDAWNYNVSLFKAFRVHDRFKVEVRGEAFNIFNTAEFNNPLTDVSSPAFGQITSTQTGTFGRQINIGARVLF